MIASETRETPRCRAGFFGAFLCVLTLAALSGTEAGAVGRGALESAVQQFLGGKPLPAAGPTTDGHVLAYDSTTGRLVWEASAGGSGDLTEIQETGDALVIASGTGPIPSISAQANVEALADAGTMAAGDLFYATSATAIARLAKGTADQTLRMNAGATAPEWDTVAASSLFERSLIPYLEGIAPPASTAVTAIYIRGGHPAKEFGDDADDPSEDYVFQLPASFSASNNVVVSWTWSADGATTGDVVWIVEVEAYGAGDLDLDGASFDTAQTVTTTTSGTDGNTVTSSITFSNAQFDDAAASDMVRVRLTRNSNEALDTCTVAAQVYVLTIREATP